MVGLGELGEELISIEAFLGSPGHQALTQDERTRGGDQVPEGHHPRSNRKGNHIAENAEAGLLGLDLAQTGRIDVDSLGSLGPQRQESIDQHNEAGEKQTDRSDYSSVEMQVLQQPDYEQRSSHDVNARFPRYARSPLGDRDSDEAECQGRLPPQVVGQPGRATSKNQRQCSPGKRSKKNQKHCWKRLTHNRCRETSRSTRKDRPEDMVGWGRPRFVLGEVDARLGSAVPDRIETPEELL